MTKGKDREHFEDYREQTQIKHSILAAYLPAYYHILKGSNDNLIYIDGFAGPGAYVQTGTGDTFNGSPILALHTLVTQHLSNSLGAYLQNLCKTATRFTALNHGCFQLNLFDRFSQQRLVYDTVGTSIITETQ